MSNRLKLDTGDILLDHRARSEGRQIKLVNRINPAGTAIKPYWQVENVETERRTTIREDRLTPPRWTNMTRIGEIADAAEG